MGIMSSLRKDLVPPRQIRLSPIIFLIDTSESMGWANNGCPIQAVNEAIEKLLTDLINMNKNNTVLKIACMQFDDCAQWLKGTDGEFFIEPEAYKRSVWKPLKACGVTNLSDALKLLKKFFNSDVFKDNVLVTPTIVLITDGCPTRRSGKIDDINYINELKVLSAIKYFRNATRIAIGYGNSVNKEVLKKFTGSEQDKNVLSTCSFESLQKLIKLVSLQSVQSSLLSSAVGPFIANRTETEII